MATMEVPQEALEVALVLWRCLMVLFLELSVADEDLAVLTPVFWLEYEVSFGLCMRNQTIDLP